MSVKITYFVHSSTTDNHKKICTGWNQGELSEKGVKQAKELSLLLADRDFDVVFCSDLKRAVDTYRILFGERIEVMYDSRLREANYGHLNGCSESCFNDDANYYITTPFPNGESYLEVEKRLRNFLITLKENYDNKHVAIISHKAPQLALDVIIKGRTWEQAIAEDWRKTGSWQPGFEYVLE